MAYKRYIWVDEESQLDAYHLNNIEDGLEGIIDGDLTVDKANKDGDGNIITGSYGSNVNFEFDHSTGMVTLKLIAKDGTILQTSSIDLPTEYLIKQIYLDDADKNLVFVLSNDTEIKCDISAIYNKIDTKADKTYVDEKLDTKVDKVAKTDKWQLYGVGDKNVDLPNGTTINAESRAVAHTVMNRDGYGRAKINTPVDDLDISNKQYVDGRFDYVLLTQSAFIYNYPLEESDRLLLINFYNKHYQKDKIPLFIVDRNGFTTTLRIAGTNIIHIFIWSDSQAPIVFFIDLTQTNIRFNRIIGGHLHSILGQSSWSGDVNARIGVNSDNQLIITDEKGNQTPGQSPSVLIPPFSKEGTTFALGETLKLQNLKINSLIYFEDYKAILIWQATYFQIRIPNASGGTTDYNFHPRDDGGGEVALKQDLANYTPISETNDIKALIPAQANKDNQLADKNFVNSSINSSAAYFIGSFATYADLLKWQNDNPTKATNNDYAYVEQDETHNNEGWRYIYVKTEDETVGTWKPQFKVNDTPFTAAQLAAINSNITSDKVTTFDNHVVNKENPHKVTKEQVGLGNVDNTSDLNKPLSTAASEALDNLNKVMPTDINLDANNHLILEHDGTEITGQKKQVVIPRYEKDTNDYYYAVETVRYDDCYIDHLFIGDPDNKYITFGRNGIIFPNKFSLSYSESYGALIFNNLANTSRAILMTSSTDEYILTNNNVKTINGESIYGTGNIETNPVFDFTSLDFTNVLDNLSDEGYASVTIEDETLKNNLKTIFDRLQNNKTSFIELPKLKTGTGTDETIQKTRMFALIQNSIYLGTGIYGLYGLMYFYGKDGNQDVLTEIRINTNLNTYNSIEFIDVKRNLVEKSSNKKIVYTNNDNGTPSTLSYSVIPNNSAIAQFNSSGQLYSNAPTSDIHVANKKYVDDSITNKLDVIKYDRTKLVFDDDNQASLPADLKALIKPYFDNNKTFVLVLYDTNTITTYYLKGMRTIEDQDITFISFDGDTDTGYTVLSLYMTDNYIFKDFINIAEYEKVIAYKSNIAKAVYTNNENKQRSMVAYSLLPGDSNIAQFDTNGHLYTNDPSIDSHCANKKYVDSAIENNLPYGTNADIDNMF